MGCLVAPNGAVGIDRRIGVDHEVDVDSPGKVMAGENGIKLNHPVFISRLYAALEGVVEVA